MGRLFYFWHTRRGSPKYADFRWTVLNRTRALQLMRGLPAMFFGSRSHTHAAKFLGIIFAKEQIPFFATFENFFFLRGDALAGFELGFLFFAQRGGENLNDLTPDGVAVVNEIHVLAGDQDISQLVGDADNFFAA